MDLWVESRPVKISKIVFPGGEVQVRLEDAPQLATRATITQNIRCSDDLMELLLVTNALRHLYRDDIRIDLICPYLPYARQDSICYHGEAHSLQVICAILNAQNYHAIEIWDVHSDVALAVLKNIVNVTVNKIFRAARFFERHGPHVLISPDGDAAKRVSSLANEFGCRILFADKIRDFEDGHITGVRLLNADQIIEWQRDFLIVDDICDDGGTIIELAECIKRDTSFGLYTTTASLSVYATHGIFSKGFEGLKAAGIQHVFTANCFRELDHSDYVTVLTR